MKLLLALLIPAVSQAAIWPDAIGPYHRAATMQVTLTDRPVWDEYGLKESESVKYENGRENGASSFTATAYVLQDSTGALAAFDWQRPAGSTPSKADRLAVETADGLLLAHGNYLLIFTGYKPTSEELSALTSALRNVDGSSLPALPGFFPSQGMVANSERYVTGPASLQKFAPGIPPSVAAFHFGAEGQLGVFHTSRGEMALGLFSYPTHQIAMQREAEFGKIPGAMVKRSGPLVAVVLSPPDPDAAERLLSQVRYQASVTLDEYVPTRRDNIGVLVINAFKLIGILLVFCVVSGLAMGGINAFRRRGGKGDEANALTTLHLS
jgi:hypothetical protein